MTFRVGQKVECIDAQSVGWKRPWVKVGCIYVIANIFPIQYGDEIDIPHLRCATAVDLVGIAKPNGFSALRFRPIVERKTDISVFTRMLLPQGENADA